MRLEHHACAEETRIAIRLAALTVLRTTELRYGDWSELERLDQPERAVWRVPPGRMKMNEEHLVPLSRQAITLIKLLPSASTRKGKLYPSHGKEGVMSNNTKLYAIYGMGYKGRMTTHGFRTLFSTEAMSLPRPMKAGCLKATGSKGSLRMMRETIPALRTTLPSTSCNVAR